MSGRAPVHAAGAGRPVEAVRQSLLIDLADAVRELTEPSRHVEYLEHAVTRTVTTRSGKIRAKRTRERRRHATTLPPLLDELHTAAVPGSGEDGASTSAAFESRPAAELDPVSVLREITDDLGFWVRTFAIERKDLVGNLRALVSAPADDAQLERIASQASRWVRLARVATGRDPLPITLADPCPYCFRRNSLVIAGDLARAKCIRCGTRWNPDTIGLLADMLRKSETQETVADVRCWMADCARRGAHDEHRDERGRTWQRQDRCVDLDGRPAVGQ